MEMKRYLALALILALALAGCGGPAEPAVSASPSLSPAPTPTPTPTPTPEPTYAPGTAASGRYENAFLGLGLDLPAGWAFLTQEEIAELGGNAQAIVDAGEEEPVQAASAVDMYALAGDKTASVSVAVQDMGALLGSVLDETAYRDLTSAAVETWLDGTYDVVSREDNTVTLAGEQHPGVRVACDYRGTTLYHQLVYLKAGSCMAAVTVTATGEEQLEKLLGAFEALPGEEPPGT